MKETILLLHGALGSKSHFDALKERLANSFDVHTMNFEGHGGEVSDNDFSIELFTDNVIAYLTANSIDKTNIFGYSMGGYVALNIALKYPAKVIKVVTLGTKFNWDVASAEKEVKMLNPTKVAEKVPQFAEVLNRMHAPHDWRLLMTKTADMMIDMAKGAKLFEDDFKKIKTPVVIGIGSLDNMVSLEESENISKLLPNATLVQLEGVRHPIDKVQTEGLVKYLSSNFVDIK